MRARAERHRPAQAALEQARLPHHTAAAPRASPTVRQDRRSRRSRRRLPRPCRRPPQAAGRSRRQDERPPGSIPCDLIRMVAAASPMTPGSVQPENGTTRSLAPVAAISRGAVKHLGAGGPGGVDTKAARHRPDPAMGESKRWEPASRFDAMPRPQHVPHRPSPAQLKCRRRARDRPGRRAKPPRR